MNTAGLYGAIAASLETLGSRSFIQIDERSCSAASFLDLTRARSAELSGGGMGVGDRILVATRRGLDFWVDVIAVWSIGAVLVPIDPAQHQATKERIIRKARASLVLGNAGPCDIELPHAAGVSIGPICRTSTGTNDRDPAAILFTSGSTGEPKGVVLSHRSLLGNARSLLSRLPLSNDDRLAIAIPFHFTSAICHFIACAITPAQFVATERRLLAGDLPLYVAAVGATCFGGAPIQLSWMADSADTSRLSLRWVMSSGDHLSARTIADIHRRIPKCGVYTVYGLTELGGRFCILGADAAYSRAGSVGKPIPGLKIAVRRDDNSQECAVGEIGEIYGSGEWLMEGYFDDKPATADCLTVRGLRTGDLGYVDEEGYVFVVGRTDDVFKVGGQKVSGIVIQEAAMKTGLCRDAAAVSLLDPVLGNVPALFYVAVVDAESTRIDLLRLLRKMLPGNHLPKRLLTVESIPRTGSGKVRRESLRALAKEKFPSGA